MIPIRRTLGLPELRIGDAVRMSAGGPEMTVFDTLPGNWVCCNYLVGTDMRLMAVPRCDIRRVARRQRKSA